MKILLLEDNISLNRAIVKVLKLDSHTVQSYLDGQDVLNALGERFDLYILDINVPHVNGLELLKAITAEHSEANVMMISSNTDLGSLQKAYELGCVDYLKKPFHLEELRMKIAKLTPPELSACASLQRRRKDDTLTKRERALLELLLDNPHSVVDYAMIEAVVYKDKVMSRDGLRALVRRLRTKLHDDTIHNVIDEGYSLSQQPVHLTPGLDKIIEQKTRALEAANNELKLKNRALLKRSNTDPLTGLCNRRKIEESFAQEREKFAETGRALCLILMDLDYFKAVNDTYGHNAGDGYLKEITQILKKTFRSSDTIGRWGGEEFVILLPKTDLMAAQEIALRLRDQIQQCGFGQIGRQTASFGIAELHENDSLHSIVERADAALYRAKKMGRNRVELSYKLSPLNA
ncbi:MAG: diguanylate cyclase [Campylobacterales bacterium]|nr:diguanylate cyclase [Campylobacterales bacterium]